MNRFTHILRIMLQLVLILGLVSALGVLAAAPRAQAQVVTPEWFDRAWDYRREVAVANPCGAAVGDYQVQVLLNASNFSFAYALSDGSDLRVTAADGVTAIPFWIENWDAGAETAVVWVKVPAIPLTGTVIYLYYGNPAPASNLVETPPVGPWTRAAGNPIVPAGGPADGRSLLAENIVYDAATGHYWMVHANYNNGSVGLVWSDDPTDPAAWHWQGTVISQANAPHILEHAGKWYIFFSDWTTSALSTQHSIQYMEADAITGPYTNRTTVLSPVSGTWENWRVDEPYVFQRNDGKWILLYMGDAGDYLSGEYYYEQVGYAIADDVTGPYTKYAGNPVLAWGPSGTYDAGTVADPWVVEFHGMYYIGYTVSPTIYSPWQTAMAATTDWVNFEKSGVIFPLGPSGAWDSSNAFRGAVTRIGDEYVLAYTGDGYQMGIATQPVYAPVNDQAAVFPFFDEFNDDTFDTAKWAFGSGSAAQAVESGGQLTLTATTTYVRIYGNTAVGMDYLVEAYAQHPDAGTVEMIPEIGLAGSSLDNAVRIASYFHAPYTNWERQAKIGTDTDDWIAMAQTADADWHTFRIYRLSPDTAGFQIDDNPAELYATGDGTTTVPTTNLPAFLMSYGNTNRLVVDWIRVRSYCGADAAAVVGAEEARPLTSSLVLQKETTGQIRSGSTANFVITVTNDGDYDLSSVTVSDPLAPSCNHNFGTMLVGDVETYACSLANVTADLTNEATVTGETPTGGSVSSTDTAFVDVIFPGLGLAFDPASQTVISGEAAGFSVTVSNTGDSLLTDLEISSTEVPDCNRSFTSLAVGASETYTCARANVTAGFTATLFGRGLPPAGPTVTTTDTAEVSVAVLDDAAWFDNAWHYRRAVTLANPCTGPEDDYQVRILLDSSNFDFAKALPDGSDLRVTALDGVTELPFWIESWDAGAETAVVWVRTALPISDTAVFLYYGNASPPGPVVVETPPVGPWTRAAGNPIVPDGGPADGRSLLAENIVYDAATGHYWMVHANYNNGSVGLVWSDDPTDPAAWHWQGTVISQANAPHILEYAGKWYIFFSDWTTPALSTQHSIQYMEADDITGPYINRTTVLSPDYGTWENWRVDEPYVFQRNDGKWILIYMGDAGDYESGQYYYEQVGYAIADDVTGPYTKYAGNPVLAWGPTGTYDAGTIADPWVVEFHDTYYIGYTVSPTIYSPWQTAMATTTDWVNFEKSGVIFPLGPSGEWDAVNAFRGAVTRIGDEYVLAYTGDGYQMGIATQPVYQTELFNDPALVFPFQDDFNDGTFDTGKWLFDSGTAAQVAEAGGMLTLTSNGTAAGDFIKVLGNTNFGMDYLLEVYAQHPQAGTDQLIAELGLMGAGFSGDKVRIADDFHTIEYWERQAALSSTAGDPWVNMNVPVDTDWHTFRLFRTSLNTAGFQVDENPLETTTVDVPTSVLPPFLMSYGTDSELNVDWVRVRSWCGAEAGTAVGAEQVVNLPPVAVDDVYETDEDTLLSISAPGVLGNDTDDHAAVLTAALVAGPAHGDLNQSADGSFTYLPEADYHGGDSFTYTANDGTHDSAPATVALTINSVNDAPVAVDDAYFVAEDGTLSIPAPGVLSNDTDVDGDSLTASLDVDAAHGSLVLNADGSFTYTPEADYNGPDGFTYTVSDGDLSDTGAVAITVNPVNDAPVVDAGEDQQAMEGELVQFSGSYTDLGLLVHQPLAPDLTYTWDFGDGATASGTLTPEHAYADEGLYTVTLLVTDDLGAVGSDTLQVTVENAAPEIVLPPDGTELWSAMHAELMLEISFTDPGWEDAHTLQVEWGDSTETRLDLPAGMLEASPTHIYDLSGVYTVLVTLADEDGGQTQHTYTVTVEPGFIQYLPVIHTP